MRWGFLTVAVPLGIGLALLAGVVSGPFAYEALLQTSAAVAAPAQQAGSTLVSGITVQNMSNSQSANVVIKFYDANGVLQTAQPSAVIPAGSQRTWYLPAHVPDLPNPFIGSAVVESDQEIVATVNTQTPSSAGGTASDLFRVGTSGGVNAPATTAFLPQVMREYYGWNSQFAVENASDSPTTLTIKYIDSSTGSLVHEQTAALNAHGSKVFQQKDDSSLTSGKAYSVVITTTGQPIASIVNFFNSGTSPTTAQFHSYNAFSGGSKKLYAPRVVRKYYGFNSGVTVMNTSSSATANVAITYYFPGIAPVVKNYVIAPYKSQVIYLGDDNANTSGLPNDPSQPWKQFGSAVITSDVDVVSIINEDNRTSGLGVTYNAFLDGQQTTRAFLPQVTSKYYGYASGIQLQNVGTSTASGTVTYNMTGMPAPVTIPFTAAVNGAWQKFTPDVPGIPENFNGAVTIQSDQPIVAIANMSFRSDRDPRYGTKYGDTFTTYNGFNLP